MAPFVYRCPNTGLRVQDFAADDPAQDDVFFPTTCTACSRVHLVQPTTGKVLGADDDEEQPLRREAAGGHRDNFTELISREL
jgi:hypothetical protein